MFAKDGNTIQINRQFNTSVENLFTAWSNPAIFRSWWKELTLAEMDFREGGKYKLQWATGCGSGENTGDGHVIEGFYKQIIPNKLIAFSWGNPGKDTNLVTLSFQSLGANKSQMELKHEFSSNKASADSHHEGWTWAMMDLDKHFNAPSRKIDAELKVEVSKTFQHPVEKLFQAWVEPKLFGHWFNRDGATLGEAHTEGKEGTTFSVDYQYEDGRVHRIYGTYQKVVLNQELQFSWVEDGPAERCDADYGYPTLVTVKFTKLGANESRIDLTHSKLTSKALAENFRSGWAACLKGIENTLNGAASRTTCKA